MRISCRVIIMSIFALSGCAGASGSLTNTAAIVSTSPAPPRELVKGTELVAVLSDQCMISDKDSAILSSHEAAPLVAALVSAVLPKVIDKGLDLAAARLKTKAAAQIASFEATTVGHLYAMEKLPSSNTPQTNDHAGTYTVVLNTKLQCLHVLGLADGSETERKQAWDHLIVNWGKTVGKTYGYDDLAFLIESPELEPYSKDGVPLFLAEMRLQPDLDHGALRVVPTFLEYAKILGNQDASHGDLTLAITLTLEGADGKVFLTQPFTLGAWSPGVSAGPKVMTRYATGWLALPAPPESAIKRAAAFSAMTSGEWTQPDAIARLEAYRLSFPFNTSVNLVETRDAKKWLGEVASVLEGSKQAISTALTNQLDPQKRETAEQAALTADLGHEQTYQLALIDERVACAAWSKAKQDNSTDVSAKWRAVVVARYAANIAAITAGHSVTFPDTLREDCSQN